MASAAPGDSLSLREILLRADSVSVLQDSLLGHTNYKVKVEAIFNEVDEAGRIKDSDTSITLVTMQGDKEISREVLYSTRRPEGKKGEEKEELKFSLSPDNPDYNFSLTAVDDSSYIIAVAPRESPPGKGDVAGTVVIDRQRFFTKRIDFEVPRPEGALKEFSTSMNFEPLEGGLVVMEDMNMRGYARAFLGIFKIRFTGEIRFTEYEILE